MYIFGQTGEKPAKTIVFREIFPLNIGPADLNWADTSAGSLLKLTVGFNFLEWYEVKPEVAEKQITTKDTRPFPEPLG